MFYIWLYEVIYTFVFILNYMYTYWYQLNLYYNYISLAFTHLAFILFYFSVQWWLYQRAAESHRNGASKLPRYRYTAFKEEVSLDCLKKQSSCIQINKVLKLNSFPYLICSSIGNVYNIPICLWLLDSYPYNPPICFVKPTSAMMIKPGKHVDANGKIYLPFLHEWKPVSVFFKLLYV